GTKTLGQIQTAEKVARKQRADDPPLDATDGLEVLESRIISVEPQHFATVPLRPGFFARPRVNAKPARGIGQGIDWRGISSGSRLVIHRVNHCSNVGICTVRASCRHSGALPPLR